VAVGACRTAPARAHPQAVHARVFTAMDANTDGRLTPEEMETFMHGEAE
jgi:hypothetical protein